MNWHQQSQEELEKILNVTASTGLTKSQAKKRMKQHGLNQLEEKKKIPSWLLFLRQFQDMMILLLIGATLVSAALGEYIDALTIVFIVLLNGILGFIQENKAEKSLDALKELASPTMKVKRDGHWITIPSVEAVPGDIVKLYGGDKVSADIRLLSVNSVSAEESALTGESYPVQKSNDRLKDTNVPIGERVNMAFAGTLVTKGDAVGVIVATGMKTEMGKIAHLLSDSVKSETPLQKRLAHLGTILITGALILTALVVIIGIMQGQPFYKMILSGVSLAVAAIPEGLPAIVTVVLALGVQRMIKRQAIVRHLPAVETLGCASVICSDKTGTLTQNKMKVTALWNPSGITFRSSKKGFSKSSYENLLSFSVLCNQAAMDTTEENENVQGDSTELALIEAAQSAGISLNRLFSSYRVEKVFPFDSERKRMTVIVRDKMGKAFVVTKGAPDVLLDLTTTIMERGRAEKLSAIKKENIYRAIEDMASRALRTIAVAYRPLDKGETIKDVTKAEKNLSFIGMEGMIDPPRPEVKEAIQECRSAGIKTIMITGDHKLTAAAIAKDIGLLPEYGKVVTGREWEQASLQDKRRLLQRVYVFARVSPEDKLNIVRELRNAGHVVAMTGDGVNDAPALKAADIGIAMGKTGTDVAKEAAALILRDDNFSTIRSAIKEGRNIYDNIRKFIRYMLASNVGEILVMLFAVMLGMPLPLVPIQILWINLITDGLPAMALGLDQPEEDGMKRPPRSASESIFANGMGWKIISRGFLIGLVTLIGFMTSLHEQPNDLIRAQTIAFSILVMAQLIHVFDCRTSQTIFDRPPFENKYLTGSVLSSILLLVLVIYTPIFQPIFHTVALSVSEWILVLTLAAIPTFALAGQYLFKTEKKE
ncbi:calcium-translocating P-type ATPase, PMCA-type [Salibacterium salarium]|uniref:P-type Ca(2+) transporter n=1 Tax=Salibacterium salarium TaxID=284579 RepID=A0A428MYZ3_9BACI|nr:calcium-translocating P-type ATPase, PMCA-type [Salibacterium salarium]RSL31374.1 calcium-translocating P-type ATPase, PMCA-type [Salibacterium salarium]